MPGIPADPAIAATDSRPLDVALPIASQSAIAPLSELPSAQKSTWLRVAYERGEVEIPPIHSLAEFRAWALSDDFPASGRIDYLDGCLEVDMSPEDAGDHNQPKTEVSRAFATLAKATRLARVYIDRMLVTHPGANLSTEPDVMVVTREAFASGRIRAVPRANNPEKSAEFEGSPDLVVEIVSDSSVAKDRRRLPALYFAAGVRELWLVDARGESLAFQIFARGESDWQETAPDSEGYLRSLVFDRRFRFDRTRAEDGEWDYDLSVRE
ncbi:MAG TPA: Uma2 family endonuclease [Pirellulales bacterium]